MVNAINQVDADAVFNQADLSDGGNDDQSRWGTVKGGVGDAVGMMNPANNEGRKTQMKGLVGGGLGLGTLLATGGFAGVGGLVGTLLASSPVISATLSPILGDAAAEEIDTGDQSVPPDLIENLGARLAGNEDFAAQIAQSNHLAANVAGQLGGDTTADKDPLEDKKQQ